MLCRLKKSEKLIVATIAIIGLIVLGLCIGLLFTRTKEIRGAVVANGHECAGIGRDILDQGGSAVDAAIAAALCEGVAMPQSTGLGGGFLMTIYIKDTGEAIALNARETAPQNATQDMFNHDHTLSSVGGLAVAIPGELRGFEEAHKRYGKLAWKTILQPTIDLCKQGNLVTSFLATMLKFNENDLKSDPSLSAVFIDPKTGEAYQEGDRVKRPQLAQTLEIVAEHGAGALYDGVLTQGFVKDIQNFGGIITKEDMKNYRPKWISPTSTKLHTNQTLHSFPSPGSGSVLVFIQNLLNGRLDPEARTVINYQRIVESFKFAYGQRSLLGDPDFVDGISNLEKRLSSQRYANSVWNLIRDNETYQDTAHYGANFSSAEDHGTAHISVLAPNGDAVSVTGTINLLFGAKRRSPSTGIVLNNEMDDFSANFANYFGMPPSPANFIKPGKRPLSSMAPSIIVSPNKHVQMVIGAAGGTKITSAIALIILKHLYLGYPFEEAIQSKRLHHQLLPMKIFFEKGFDKNVVQGLEDIGHKYEFSSLADGFAAATGISSSDGKIVAVSDHRRPGSVAYVY